MKISGAPAKSNLTIELLRQFLADFGIHEWRAIEDPTVHLVRVQVKATPFELGVLNNYETAITSSYWAIRFVDWDYMDDKIFNEKDLRNDENI